MLKLTTNTQLFKKYFGFFYQSFPVISKRINKNTNNWIPKDLKDEKNNLIELNKQARSSGSENLKRDYKEKYNQCKHKLSNSKRSFYDNNIKNANNIGKTSWQIINKEIQKNTNMAKQDFILRLNNAEISNPVTIANSVNDYFVTVVENMVKDMTLPKTRDGHRNNEINDQVPNFRCPPLDRKKLSDIFDSLINKWSSGYDNVPVNVLKFAKGALIKP